MTGKDVGGDSPPAVVLGAGYAGISVTQEISRRSHGRVPLVLVDRHPIHVLRTELYEVGRIAAHPDVSRRWTVPIEQALDGVHARYVQGEVRSIDLDRRTVQLDSGTQPYRSLIICLGSVPAYYGVPGAEEFTHQVYRLSGALRLANTLRKLTEASSDRTINGRPQIVVVGGGSTGTEVAAEIASTDWSKIVGKEVHPPQVQLVVGSVPLLAGLPDELIHHARELLARAGVVLDEGTMVKRVEKDRLTLTDGREIPFDLCVWAAGVQAPPLVRNLPTAHGPGGRLKVTEMLELPDRSGVFGVGDVIHFEDPKTRVQVPATAQAALAEAPIAGTNVVAQWLGRPLKRFEYRERSVLVSVGLGQAAGNVRSLTIWGRPAALLKSLVQREYAVAREVGTRPPGL